jgi:hypothetical protein
MTCNVIPFNPVFAIETATGRKTQGTIAYSSSFAPLQLHETKAFQWLHVLRQSRKTYMKILK